MLSWQVGAVKVTCVVEKDLEGVLEIVLPDATPERVARVEWLQPHFATADGRLLGNVQAMIVETPSGTIMVDCCIGDHKDLDSILPIWTGLQTGFLGRLAQAGYTRDSIDMVLCTHLHTDHIGWNTMREGDRWVPTFPRARYIFGRQEYEGWNFPPPGDRGAEWHRPADFVESIQPVVEAGLVTLVENDHRLTPEVRLVPSPGHTHGHCSVVIESEGARAMISGDFAHHPCQFAYVDISSAFDRDPAQAVKTRTELLDQLADQPVLLIGTHFAHPTAGHIVRDGDAYRFRT